MKTNDLVNHPNHYTAGGYETIDLIEMYTVPYHIGNAIKYISRADLKGSKLIDLEKAEWYVKRFLTYVDNYAESFKPVAIQTETLQRYSEYFENYVDAKFMTKEERQILNLLCWSCLILRDVNNTSKGNACNCKVQLNRALTLLDKEIAMAKLEDMYDKK
jgi:Protein of unknwon function (DUF3310).